MYGHILRCIAGAESNQPIVSHIYTTVDITTRGHSSKCTAYSLTRSHVNTTVHIQNARAITIKTYIACCVTRPPLKLAVEIDAPPQSCITRLKHSNIAARRISVKPTIGLKNTRAPTVEICV